MGIGQIKLYDLFRKELHLPDDKAAAFVLAVEDVVGMEADMRMQFVATRDDMNHLSAATKEQIHHLSVETKDQIHHLELKIEQSKGDIYKAIFWTGKVVQLLAILGGILAIVKFMK